MKKRILITGANSYVGRSFRNYVAQTDEWIVDELNVHDDSWKNYDFSRYDVVFHVAAIVHLNNKKGNLTKLYYRVNRDLAIEIANLAKSQGVKQFIFMSTASVYGEQVTQKEPITIATEPHPTNHYGKSKLEAERRLDRLADEDFKVVVLRPPMIYGPNTKGNYPRLSKLAQKLPIFPKVHNQRSMIFIDNFSEFVRLMIVNEENGVFHPQNDTYINTSQLVKDIAEAHGRKLFLMSGFHSIFRFLASKKSVFNKLFGDFTYHSDLSHYKQNYIVVDYKKSVELSEAAQESTKSED